MSLQKAHGVCVVYAVSAVRGVYAKRNGQGACYIRMYALPYQKTHVVCFGYDVPEM